MSACLHYYALPPSLPCEVLSISRFQAESSIKRNGNNIFLECKWITICNLVCMKNGNILKIKEREIDHRCEIFEPTIVGKLASISEAYLTYCHY
jgi:hypothetical protein